MRRIMQCEFDSHFFQLFGEFFIKSFYEHNKGWELYVVDLGLAPAEREILQQYGTVKQYQVDPCSRWLGISSRIVALCELVRDDNLILRLDTDSVILASYDSLVDSILDDGFEFAGPELPHAAVHRARNLERMAELLGVPTTHDCLHTKALANCLSIMRGTDAMTSFFEWLLENYEQLRFAGKEEETIMSAAMYKRGIRCKPLPWEYFWSTAASPKQYTYGIPSMNPVTSAGKRVSAVHFAFSKWYMLNSASVGGHESWRGWRDVFSNYFDKLAWPSPADARPRAGGSTWSK